MLGSTRTVEPRARCNDFVPTRSIGDERWLVASCLLACALVLALLPAPARAFSEPLTYIDDARYGGGGGRWFTSSPAEGYGCSVCHTGGGSAKLAISGLPEAGYTPGATYELILAWPEFAARARALRMIPGSTQRPGVGLVAELVAESGLGGGRLELIDPALSTPAETCQIPGGGIAAELYAMLPGEAPVPESRVTCDAVALGQRCILAAISCGAEQVRARWTAPLQSVGPIWFSAGFVTTEALESTAANDAVLEITSPIQPVTAATDRYESTLEGGCRVMGGAVGGAAAQRSDALSPRASAWLFALSAVGFASWRRAGKRRSAGRERA
jgi:hypothetical protein